MLIREIKSPADPIFKVALYDEIEEWDHYNRDETGGWSMVEAYSFKLSELASLDIKDWGDVEYGDGDERIKLAAALRKGKIGTKLAAVKLENSDFDLGIENLEAPEGYKVLVTFQ